MARPEALAILQKIASTGKAYEANDVGSRDRLVELSLALLGSLEIPSEFLQRTFWAEPCKSALIRTAADQNMFQHLRDASPKGLTTEELANKTGVDWDLGFLGRILSHLAAMHVLTVSEGKWHSTPLTDGLADQNFQSSIEFCYDSGMPSFYKFPEWFKHNKYQSPKTDLDGPFQYAWKSDKPFFPWLEANPPNLANFANFMSAYRAGKPSWFDPGFYPITDRLIIGFDPSISPYFICDVGGGRGHDLLQLSARFPSSLPGKLILQDLPAVLASIDTTNTSPPFETQAHDFFTPQPVKGARAYMLHSILHDWGDDEGVKILEALKPALWRQQQQQQQQPPAEGANGAHVNGTNKEKKAAGEGYSKVLLFEIVVAGEKPSFASTTMDMQMLAHLCARERTEAHWRALVARAGFEVVGIYGFPGVAESVIELALAE